MGDPLTNNERESDHALTGAVPNKHIGFLLLMLFVASALPVIFQTKDRFSPELPVFGNLPAFSFTNSSGTTVTAADLRDKVAVINFFFTSCHGPCPTMTGELKRLQDRFSLKAPLVFMSVSVDPETDTVPKLAAYAERFQADLRRWHFVRGDLPDVIKFGGPDGLALNGTSEPNLHTTRFVLVDKTGQVRGFFRSDDSQELLALQGAIVKLSEK